MTQLHPNLARIAIEYDRIVEKYKREEINARQSRESISALVARDDEGAEWSIDPDTGRWVRRNIDGRRVFAMPPSYGLATPTAHDFSDGTKPNPDQEVSYHNVDESILYGPQDLKGTTRVSNGGSSPSAEELLNRFWFPLSIFLVIAAIAILFFVF